MPLAHFPGHHFNWGDPIYLKAAEANFYPTKEDKHLPILTEQLKKIEGNFMYFNFNWLSIEKKATPLKEIVEIMGQKAPLHVSVSFHDKEGMVIYKTDLKGFKFTKIVNDLDYGWENGDKIKDLIVEFDYKDKIISVY